MKRSSQATQSFFLHSPGRQTLASASDQIVRLQFTATDQGVLPREKSREKNPVDAVSLAEAFRPA
jgi:hypothetical protein